MVAYSRDCQSCIQDGGRQVLRTRRGATLEDAQAFYHARYAAAAAPSLPLRAHPDELAACELRTSSLLFQIPAMGASADKDKAWTVCAACPELMAAFVADIASGRSLARARLQKHPNDDTALFLLGKLDSTTSGCNWERSGARPVGTSTGKREDRSTRCSKRNPGHVRARVARAWIDYIVDTKMPRGTRWLLGGGNKKKGLRVVRDAAERRGRLLRARRGRTLHCGTCRCGSTISSGRWRRLASSRATFPTTAS